MLELIDIRRRIKSVRNTQQITQAMKTVSTAKFQKAQRIVLEARPYLHSFPCLLSEIALWAGRYSHPLLMQREENKVEGIIMTSDKGLCGAFNSNLLAKALSFFEERATHSQVNLVLIGKKAVTFFKDCPFPVKIAYSEKLDRLSADDLRDLSQYLIQIYILNKTDAVYVAYNEFKSILSPRVTMAKLLPVELPKRKEGKEKDEKQEGLLPDWEPGEVPLLNNLFPLYIENQIRHFFFESLAAEHAARMMAMDNATKNAEDLITELTLVLNKVRQASITKELLEIMTAVEALARK